MDKDDQKTDLNAADEAALDKVINQGLKFEEIPMPGSDKADDASATSASDDDVTKQDDSTPPSLEEQSSPVSDSSSTVSSTDETPATSDSEDSTPTLTSLDAPEEKSDETKDESEDKPSDKSKDESNEETSDESNDASDTQNLDDMQLDQEMPSGEMGDIKKSALEELRPLVGKLSLSPEEKFDTLLLVIRSTDDQSLLQELHDAAKDIEDESKKASALLNVIKEVDYFTHKLSNS